MSVQLLDKTRKINKFLHNNNSSKVVFNDICAVMAEILNSNILVISKKGKVLGTGQCDGIEEIHERFGTLFVYRYDESYDIDDIILCEYGTTVVGLEMMRSVNEENTEETRKVQIVRSAISTLSFSELEAITHIFDELDGTEGILVASKIADRVGITRSVIVNALRKFESAGVIESRSSGMKGTYIKVVNDVVFDELNKIKKQRG